MKGHIYQKAGYQLVLSLLGPFLIARFYDALAWKDKEKESGKPRGRPSRTKRWKAEKDGEM